MNTEMIKYACYGWIVGMFLALILVIVLGLPIISYYMDSIYKQKPVSDEYKITTKDFESRVRQNIEMTMNLKQCEISLAGHMASENVLIKYLHYHKIITDREFFEMTQRSMTR